VGLGLELTDRPLVFPDSELKTGYLYRYYDLDLARGPVRGRITVGAVAARGGGEQHVLLESSETNWTRHLTARLFKDGLELGSAEYDISFAPTRGEGLFVDATTNPVVLVSRRSQAEASFALTGPESVPLEEGTYRLWILLDMRDLPARPDAFRGVAVNDPGAYHGLGEIEPDPGHSGGVVIQVISTKGDPDALVGYFEQHLLLEGRKHEIDNPTIHGLLDTTRTAATTYPEDPRFAWIQGVLYAYLGDCESAIPYFRNARARDSTWFESRGPVSFGKHPEVRGCAGKALNQR
jgi:hypothetical protein